MTFTPSEDGVPARYTAELCTNVTNNLTEWRLDVIINEKGCIDSKRNRFFYFRPGNWHSKFTNDVNVTDLNCSYVCLSTDFDLIFDSCYLLKSTLRYGEIDSQPYDSYHKIKNAFKKETIFPEAKIVINNFASGVAIHLYAGVPPTDYDVQIYSTANRELKPEDVTKNCTAVPASRTINCFVSPPYGCYYLLFTHYAPWASGFFHKKSFIESPAFCHKKVEPAKVSGNSWIVVWACGGVLALCACAGVARLLLRTRTADKIKEQVRNTWVQRRTDTEATLQQDSKGACKHVLLLYARECEAGQRAVTLLKALLSQVVPGNVYDIFSAEVMALAAAAPAQWTRELLERADVRVLLLQTPALACLYRARADDADATFKLCSPLLGSRVALRSPHFGDTLLHYALRLVAETSHHRDAYTKYYLAQLSELKVEIFPQIVRFTRYLLPAAITRLLQDVASQPAWEPPEGDLQECTDAIAHFVEYATNNPNYLMDELIFV
ncbi:hypothetical protein K1T71_009046 [Dendrolimus kikuchii]|uniref:Uncharacterized protein n=1 Tax=Dendrolimus kikuchii TaxID=765133 RepID=A0ACC1CX92_9NEOP|nr:hypothetical protein K1T71_009046 [Dendrolimus kikuchii]